MYFSTRRCAWNTDNVDLSNPSRQAALQAYQPFLLRKCLAENRNKSLNELPRLPANPQIDMSAGLPADSTSYLPSERPRLSSILTSRFSITSVSLQYRFVTSDISRASLLVQSDEAVQLARYQRKLRLNQRPTLTK